MTELHIGASRLLLLQGDITAQRVAAIVNAANTTLLGGGGVDGAIHRRGGPAILAECKHLRATQLPNGLSTGDAVSTTAGNLHARCVIHTVGPVWRGGAEGEAALLASSYERSLDVARAEGLRSVAFPSISTGIYGFPVDRAARIALATVTQYLQRHDAAFDEVRIVLFSDDVLTVFENALEFMEL